MPAATPAVTPPALKTWADVKTMSGLRAFSISICAFGENTVKEWVKITTEHSHWARIIDIAETSGADLREHPARGFSWVSAAVIDDQVMALLPPAHLRQLIAGSSAAS